MSAIMLMMVIAAQVIEQPKQGETVIVTGRRFADEYEQCLKMNCPPEREVEAALNLSVAHFRSGRYAAARKILQRTISRNKKYAGEMPGKISDLYSTYADLALHEGYPRIYRSATYRSADVLRDHLGKTHPNTIITRAAIGDMLIRDGRPLAGDEIYRDTIRDAKAAGQQRLAAFVAVRRAWIALQTTCSKRASTMLDQIIAENPNDPALLSLARAMQVRIAIMLDDDALTDRLIADWRSLPGERPILLWQPPDPNMSGASASGFGFNVSGSGISDAVDWLDIGYWIRPSGLVEQAELLRPTKAAGWAAPLIKQIGRRRYAPLDNTNGSPGTYRIERISLRQNFDFVTGTRIAQRTGPTQLVRVDITDPQTELGTPLAR